MAYPSENIVCRNCSKNFVIEPNDFSYYEKIGVLPPKDCPECRRQLRLAFRNERSFYKRQCDNCKKDIITIYSANKPYPVWCPECWWSDSWDAREFGIDYDPNKSFLEQFREVLFKTPKISLIGVRNINSHYLNITADNKNCYFIIESSNNENCTHCYWIQLSEDLVDSSFTDKVELSYEVDDCYDCNNLKWSKGCHNCLDGAFLLDCRGCTECLGCINLRGQKYNIFNKQYTKEEYKEKLKSYKLDTFSGFQAFEKEFQNFINDKPRKFAEITNAVNSTGNYMVNVKNNKQCFHSYDAEDNAYCVHAWRVAKDNMDCDTVGRVSVSNYQCINTGQEVSNNKMSILCWGTSYAEYSHHCLGSQELLGCAELNQKKYCILNKQYTKEEYKKLKSEIINRMKQEKNYGEFLPASFSLFGYNEAAVAEQFPLSKEEAVSKGFKWEDTPRGTYGKETVDWASFPDSILDLPADFDPGKEVFVCRECKKNYRIIEDELGFYKRMSIPLPRHCPECRHLRRMKNRGPNKLWQRGCMNKGCQNKFATPYSPDSSEIIFCEKCYNQEVY